MTSTHSLLPSTSRARLQALYSDFSRQKQSNPSAYQANVEWWRGALETIVSCGSLDTDTISSSRLILQADQNLLDKLRVEKVGKPLALGAVIDELLSRKSLVHLTEFMTSKVSIYDSGWLPYRIASFVVGKPLWWALEQVGIVGDEGLLSSSKERSWWGKYVLLSLVEKAAESVLSFQQTKSIGPADSLYTLDGFRQTFAHVTEESKSELDENDAKVILKYLERERKVVVVENEVVKFIDVRAPLEERTITTIDRGILELKLSISSMNVQITGIQSKLEECTSKAITALQQKQKTLSLSYLRSRKQMEELLSKRLSSLGILESTLLSIETAAGDIQIMKIYESSTTTLRAILSHPALAKDNIDETMEAMAEANHDAQEIDNAVRLSGDVALGVDEQVNEDEIEDEWRELLQEVERPPRQSGETINKLAGLNTPTGALPAPEINNVRKEPIFS